jgi:tape measure domain-containing protein
MTDYIIRIIVNGQDNASGPLGNVGSALGNMGQIAGGILTAQMFQNIARGIMDVGKEALDSYINLERMDFTMRSLAASIDVKAGKFNNLTDAMAGSSEHAKTLTDWVRKLAIESPFNMSDINMGFQMALRFSETENAAKSATLAVTNWATATGRGGFEIERVFRALEQMHGAQKVMGQDVLQLTQVGIGIDYMSDALGMTTKQFMDLKQQGLIPADEFITKLTGKLQKDWGGAAKEASQTVGALKASLQDLREQGLAKLLEGPLKSIQPLLVSMVEKLQSPAVQDWLQKTSDKLGEITKKAIDFAATFRLKNVNFNFVEKIAGAMGGVGLAGLFAGMLGPSLVNGFMSILPASFSAIGVGITSLAPQLFYGIYTMIRGLSLPLGEAFFRLFAGSGIAMNIFSGLTIALSTLSPKVGGLFFRTFMTGGVVEKIGGIFLKIGGFAKFLAPLSGIITFGVPLLLIATAIMAVVGAFKLMENGKLQTMLAPLANAFALIKNVIVELTPFLIEMGQYIGGAFMAASEKLASQVIPWLVDQFQKFSLWFKENQPLIQAFIQTIADFIVNRLIPAVVGAWQFIAPILTGIVDLMLGLGKIVMQVVTGDWAGAWETAKQTAGKVWDALKKAFWGFLNWIAERMGSSLAEIGAVWSNNWEQFKTIVSTIWQGMKATLDNNLTIIVTAIAAWLANAGAKWRAGWNDFLNVIVAVWSNVKNTISNKINDIKAMLYSKIDGFADAGWQIVAGIEEGIKDAWRGLISTFEGLIAMLPQAVKDILGIASPSKVFAGFGKNIMEGLAQGLIKNSSLPIEATLKTSGAISSATNISHTNQWNVTIHNPQQNAGSVRDDIRLLQLAAGA